MLVTALGLLCLSAPSPHPSLQGVNVHITRTIEGSLAEQVPQHAAALGAQVARLIRWRGDMVRNVHRRDELRVLFELVAGEPELVALTYQGEEIQLRAYRMEDPQGIPRFYDETGQLIEPWMQRVPVPQYVQITETVQRGRGKRRHRGLDLKAPEGTPITSPYAGVVSRVNWSTRANGNCVDVTYNNGRHALFLHLSHIAEGIRPGARVRPNAPIGHVGSTGRSGAPHLHYEMYDTRGQLVDPLEAHGISTARVHPSVRADFAVMREELDRMLLQIVEGAT